MENEFKIEDTVEMTSRCPVCNRPFTYWPKKDEVVMDYRQMYCHRDCIAELSKEDAQ